MINKFSIKNKNLKVEILRKGAQLSSVKGLDDFEYMWQGEDVWQRHAPNLFPIVGSLIDHEYVLDDKTYSLKHHGFARDLEFDLLHQSEHSACFVLQQSKKTFPSYPFKFTLLISFSLNQDNKLSQTFRVINTGESEMPVSFGGHPAFNANPVEDYVIDFDNSETGLASLLTGPYIGEEKVGVFKENSINLSKHTFDNDALVFQSLNSKSATLRNQKSKHQVKVDFSEFPYLGIWAKPEADFVCIEPWQGLADFTKHNKDIRKKKGVVWLAPNQEISKTFHMEFSN